MTRLTELRGVLAGSAASGAAVRWDRRAFDVHSVIQTARDRRSEFVAEQATKGLRALGRWSGLSGLLSALRRHNQCRRTLHQLSALDDRLLSDIGVHRADIEATAALCCDETPAASNSVWYGLSAWAQHEVRRRRTQRELSAMPDELLADIGIERSEIPAIAAALAEEPSEANSTSEGPANLTVLESGSTGEVLVAQVLAFNQLQRSARGAVNQNQSQSSAA